MQWRPRALRMILVRPFEKELHLRAATPTSGRHASASPLRLPGAEASFLALHAGDGRTGLRRPSRSLPADWPKPSARPPVRRRPHAICYALGWTQHSKGSQLIRTAAILQLLLGNIGRPGGGIMALRGHASIQGSTDIPTLFDLLPGYLPMPTLQGGSEICAASSRRRSTTGGWWANFDKYIVSLLKAYYGDAATAENDYGFRWLPRLTGDHSHMAYWIEMAEGKMEGLFAMGDNPAVAGPNARLRAARDGQAEMAGRARSRRNRNRDRSGTTLPR